MGITRLLKYDCNLCGQSETLENKPNGWVIISIEDKYCDRMWHEKVICESCIKQIEFQRNKNGH